MLTFMPMAFCKYGLSIFCHSMPSDGNPVYRPLRLKSSRKWWITGGGMTYPMFSASSFFSDWHQDTRRPS